MANSTPTAIQRIQVSDLHFDVSNPRLAEYGVTRSTKEEDILAILWDAMDVRELVQSIAASGYFDHEPLIVVEERGKHVVVEGNRRLAAVKVLVNGNAPGDAKWELPKITPGAREKLKELPAILSTRKDSWRYLGFKHVNGPAKWSSYAKATYIAEVHRKFGVSLEDIADQIGDRHKTVQRLYRGLMVIEQAEKERVYDREDRYRQRFAFSHLYTGLDYDGVTQFLKLKQDDPEAEEPVPRSRKKELGDLCLWLFGSKRLKKPPVVEKQNPHLRQLDAALKSREAVAALRDGADIAAAFELSRPPIAVFEESLLKGKRELTRARAHLTTGYDGSEDLLRIAGTVAEIADDIYTEMDRKRNPGKRKRLTEQS